MTEEEQQKQDSKFKQLVHKEKRKSEESSFIEQYRIALKNIEDRKKYIRSVLLPLIFLAILFFLTPVILAIAVPVPVDIHPANYIIGGMIPILLGILYPYITWKNRENDINGKMHLFITHLRVLAISDYSLKDIINVIGGNPVYGALGEELKKISVLTSQWRNPLAKSFQFVSKRTPSKILKDFLDRFSQSLMSGVDHREFIENEQGAVLEEYKTVYESSNENITILNEVYVSFLIAIIFVMALGIVMPIILGGEDMTTFLYLSGFMLVFAEGMLLYLLKAMIPQDEIWRVSGDKGEIDEKLDRTFRIAIILSVIIGVALSIPKFYLMLPQLEAVSLEIIIAMTLTPLLWPGLKTFMEEDNIARKERNFLAFLPALGSIATMRGGKINESVYYLSEKDYGILTWHIRDLYRRLRTRINDDAAWEWFGVDTGSNYIQRASEMFRQATYAAANPREVSTMISDNIRKIRDLRFKKMSIIKTSASLFGGITFGIAFAIYVSLIIAQHLNDILLEGMAGRPFEGTDIDTGSVLSAIPPQIFGIMFLVAFLILVVHSFMMGFTLKVMRGSHFYVTFVYAIPMIWVASITSLVVEVMIGGFLEI